MIEETEEGGAERRRLFARRMLTSGIKQAQMAERDDVVAALRAQLAAFDRDHPAPAA